METENKKNEMFLYVGAFFLTTGSLSILALLLMLMYISI